MKRTMAIATFLMAGAGALGVGANPLHMRGSDTLFTMINDVLSNPSCGGGADELHYVGGGSGNASSQMQKREQEVGPMSSFLGAGTADTCGHPAKGAAAEGIVWALDGVSVLTDKDNVPSCGAADTFGEMRWGGNGATTITVYDMNEDGDGVPGDGVINCGAALGGTGTAVNCSPYTLASGSAAWRDVLNVLYFGIHNNDRGTGSGLDGLKACNSDLRYTLAGTVNVHPAAGVGPNAPPVGYNAWTQNFEGGCTGGGCTRIEHLWRRGDDSGTTDTFQSLVCGSGSDADCQFCNGYIDGSTKNDDGVDWDPIRRTCRSGTPVAGQNLAAANKRTCTTYRDQALTGCPVISGQPNTSCGLASVTQAEKDRRWSLGLVQPVVVPENLILSERYPSTTTGTCTAPNVRRPAQLGPGFPTTKSMCPCGEPIVGGACTVTSTGGTTPQSGCYYSGFLVPAGAGSCSPKVFNNEIRHADGSIAVDPTNRQYLAAAYRMRTGFGSGNCTQPDSTEQIGCLAANLACTIGFAGREACDPTNPNNDCMEIQGVEPTNANIRLLPAASAYKISRELYLNSMMGFENVKTADFVGGTVTINDDAVPNTFDPDGAGPLVASGARTQLQLDAEINLAGCLSKEPLTQPIIINRGFVTLYDPLNYNTTDHRCVRCRDFDSSPTACGVANVDACTNNGGITTSSGVTIPFAASNVQTGAGVECDVDVVGDGGAGDGG